MLELFQSANALAHANYAGNGHAEYDVSLLSITGGRVESSASVSVWTDRVEDRHHAGKFHALFIAGGVALRHVLREERVLRWLRLECSRCEAVVPIGEGRALLEAAGIQWAGSALDCVIRTNARDCLIENEFADTNAAPLREALLLIELDLGSDLAREVASQVMPRYPRTGPTAAIRTNVSGRVSLRIQASVHWLEANGDRQVTIEDAAQVAAMSERNFLRRFKIQMGITPSDYLLHMRINMSCRLLVETDLPVDKIARRCGLGTGGRLAKLFRKHLSTTPTEYRTRRGHTVG
ncbi:helix-turn-helix domain-containing protein [Paraburkholderia unamae]|uniref:Helix-turn-helix domain-containing protein n=1 Tax=Paraburkholderia unamae TaxID=219649 RepID=A0ACC6RMM3_9BURK